MADQDLLQKTRSLLFIKPEDHDTFHSLVLTHISQHPSKGARTLAADFLTSYGQQLWPIRKRNREHLNQAPSKNDVQYWAGGWGRGCDNEGPLFEYHSHTVTGMMQIWHNRQNGVKDIEVKDNISLSKLGGVLERYVAAVVRETSNGAAQKMTLRPQALMKHLLRPAASSSAARTKPSLSATTLPHATGANDDRPRVDPSLSSSNSKAGRSQFMITDYIKGNSSRNTTTDLTGPDAIVQSPKCSQQKAIKEPYIASTATSTSPYANDDAVESIKKIRGLMYKGASLAGSTEQRQKRRAPATALNTAPPKKQKTSDRNSRPPRGTFDIPPGLKRLEVVPLSKRPGRSLGVSNTTDARLSSHGSVPLENDQNLREGLPIVDIAFNYMEDVSITPPPHADEEARREMLATYMKETGGMGGLPLVH